MKFEFVTTSQGWLLVEMSLTACGLGFFFLNSRQKQLEAIKLQEDAVNQEVILREKVQEARLEDAEEQVRRALTALFSEEVSSAVLKTMK